MKIKLPATLLKDLSVGGLIVAIAITSLTAATFTNPLGSAFKSTDNGGILPAIDAYKDGVGVIVLDNLGTGAGINNSAMNTLVYKYGETAKTNNTTISNEVLNGSGSTNVKDKELATNINNIVSGTIVVTTNINGTACSDGSAATVGETWLNGICQGGIVGNLASNGLIYDNCEGGANTYLGAKSYCESKGMRLPIFEETKGSVGILESCPRIPLTWTWTSTYAYGYFYYVWGESTYFYGKSNPPDSNDVYLVRCVK